MSNLNSAIRYFTLLTGWSLMIWVLFINFEDVVTFAVSLIIFAVWVLFPYYLYFYVSRKEERFYMVVVPALALNIIYLLTVLDYSNSEDSTAALVFIFIPIAGIVLLAIVYGLLFLMNRFIRRGS